MDEEKKVQPIQWHPAFYAGIQIEFAEEKEKLIFENEHQLGTKPKSIDVLIIKKVGTEPIRKNIGRIFRGHNIIEYKSPEDYLSIDDFYKVYGYACFYKSDSEQANGIDVKELTITLVSHGYPREVIRHLYEVRGYRIEKAGPGIYYVAGDIIPIQILVTKRLNKKQNMWLRSLTNQLESRQDVIEIYDEYARHQEEKLYSSVMSVIVKANSRKFEVEKMCEALFEIFMKQAEPEIQERIKEREEISKNVGKLEGRLEGKIEEIIDMGQEFNLSEADILNRIQMKLNMSGEEAQRYYNQYARA